MSSNICLIDHHRTGEDLGSLYSTSSHFHSIALFVKAQVRVPHRNTSHTLNSVRENINYILIRHENKPSGLVLSKVVDLHNIKPMRHGYSVFTYTHFCSTECRMMGPALAGNHGGMLPWLLT